MEVSFSRRAAALAAAACLTSGGLAQQETAPREAAVGLAALPTSVQGKTAASPDISVSLKHTSPAGAKCADPKAVCEDAAHWTVELKTAAKPGAAETVPLGAEAELRQKLTSAAAPKAKKHGDVTLSEATLSIRAAPGTPFCCVQTLLQMCGSSTIHAIEFAVSAPSGAGEQRLPVPLPTNANVDLVDSEPRSTATMPLRLALDSATGQCIRDFGKATAASDAAGDAKLREWLVKAADGWKRLGDDDAPVVLTVEPRVPLQAVVAVIDACHEHRIAVQFRTPEGSGSAKK